MDHISLKFSRNKKLLHHILKKILNRYFQANKIYLNNTKEEKPHMKESDSTSIRIKTHPSEAEFNTLQEELQN